MKHLIVTRCNFKDDERFNKYFSAMKKYYIPSINSQTDKNFKTDMLTKFDPFFQARAGQILDLRTQDEKRRPDIILKRCAGFKV